MGLMVNVLTGQGMLAALVVSADHNHMQDAAGYLRSDLPLLF